MCVTRLLGVYCGGVFLYLHVMTTFVYMWAVYCFGVCGTFFSVCNNNMSCIFNILRFEYSMRGKSCQC